MYTTDLEGVKLFNIFTGDINKDISLEEAVEIFKKDGDSRYFSLIYLKVYKTINFLSQSVLNNYLDAEEIQSQCIEKLLETINTWDKTKNVKFLTLYYSNIRNLIYTLTHKKYFRDMTKYCVNFSDFLSNQSYENNQDLLDFLVIPGQIDSTDKIDFNSHLFNEEQNRVLSFIHNYNIRHLGDVCEGLGVKRKDLMRNLRSIKKTMQKFSII